MASDQSKPDPVNQLSNAIDSHSINHSHDPPAPEEDAHDPAVLNRTWSILIRNESGLPLKLTGWPVPVSSPTHVPVFDSPTYAPLSSFRGAHFHSSVLPLATLLPSSSTPIPVQIATIRAPQHLDPRHHTGWIYFDLVKPGAGQRIHFQLFVEVSRKGLVQALVGQADLDSSVGNPMPGGKLGEGVSGDHGERSVEFVLGEELAKVKNGGHDETRFAKDIPGKGVETCSYVSLGESRVSLVVGNEARYHENEREGSDVGQTEQQAMRMSRHKLVGVEERYLGVFVDNGGEESYFEGHVKILPMTGISTGKGLNSTAQSTAKFVGGRVLNYGFHDAGEGRLDQVYVYVTPNHESWLGDLISNNEEWRGVPFCRLALAGSHDSGMFGSLDPGLAALIQSGQLGNALASHAETTIATPVVHYLVKLLEELHLKPERVIGNIALTQKDDFHNQLRMMSSILIGVRFFDFRPGFCFHDCIKAIKGPIHHQHAMVPGCLYLTFLTQIFEFLARHPSEIVLVEVKSSGFVLQSDKVRDGKVVVYSMVPSEEELAAVLEEARKLTSSEIIVGGAQDLDRPIGDLIKEGRRLLIVDRMHRPEEWEKADSYDHPAYNTVDPAQIIAQLDKTHAESSVASDPVPGRPNKGAIYQLQATPTSNIKSDVFASITYSDSSSLLTFMKPRMDRATYPWVASHHFSELGSVIFLNDFVDGVLVERALNVSKERVGLN